MPLAQTTPSRVLRPAVGKSAPGRIGVAVGALLIVAASARFWIHDALPYLLDYSQEEYGRFWRDRIPLLLHIAGGTIGLFAGPFQLWSGFRRRFRTAHRWTGYAYLAGIALAAASSFYLSFHTTPDFGLALFILAVAWWATITMAFIAIRNGRIDAHREWMARSYIVTFSFVSFRYLVGLSVFQGLGQSRTSTVLWISWVIPMMAYELWLQRDRVTRPRRRAAAAPDYS